MKATPPQPSDHAHAAPRRFPPKSSGCRPKLCFVVTEDWYFVSHRLSLAIAARESGFDVSVVTRVREHGALIKDNGIDLIPLEFNRSGVNPIEEARTVVHLIEVYRRLRPDIVHHVALKPVIYGSLAARVTGVKGVVNALGGLGHVFSGDGRKARWLKPVARQALRFALAGNGARLIVQNAHDRRRVVDERLVKDANVRLVRGVGVNPNAYGPCDVDRQPPAIALPARLLKEKGVFEFVEAARLAKRNGLAARFILLGEPDPQNPASISPALIQEWVKEGVVESWGWRVDMPDVLSEMQIICLPSYHEGLPRALLEASAAGCAIVASDIAGCRELISDQRNGLLVPARNAEALWEAIVRLANDPIERSRLGAAARHVVATGFSLETVIRQTFSIYAELWHLVSPDDSPGSLAGEKMRNAMDSHI